LFHTLFTPDDAAYVAQVTCTLVGEVDSGALERAWQAVVARHEALRTSVHWEGVAEPTQVVWQRAPTGLRFVDL
jgi:arthrofactin-type cyclic lipopeptide synthetase B